MKDKVSALGHSFYTFIPRELKRAKVYDRLKVAMMACFRNMSLTYVETSEAYTTYMMSIYTVLSIVMR